MPAIASSLHAGSAFLMRAIRSAVKDPPSVRGTPNMAISFLTWLLLSPSKACLAAWARAEHLSPSKIQLMLGWGSNRPRW
eukprot:9315408-Lingulodinium_polyedra.AAC.1